MREHSIQWHRYMAWPAFLLFILFFIYPLSHGVQMSMMDWDGFSEPEFIGFQNFVRFFSDSRASRDVLNTVFFALGSAPLLNIFGLALALLLNRSFSGRGVVRAAVYMPAVISPMIMGSIWYLLLQPGRGLFYILAGRIGVESLGNWMLSGNAMLVIILINVWQFAGMTMVIYLAGLQQIPGELYEAAHIAGANAEQRFRFITIPQLLPALKVNVITNIIGSLSVFEVILALTDGGPGYSTESLSIYIMRMCYGSRTGYSTAVAIILFFIILVPVLISLSFFKKAEEKHG